MVKRKGKRQHYERVFEEFLRDNGILYIAVDESKRPIYDGCPVKNFDFIVSSFNGKFMIDVKGRKFGKHASRWDNWIGVDDLVGLKMWSTHFDSVRPLLVHVYWLETKDDEALFADIRAQGRNTYAFVAVTLGEYFTNAIPRAGKWKAIYVPRKRYSEIVKPLSFFIPELQPKWKSPGKQ